MISHQQNQLPVANLSSPLLPVNEPVLSEPPAKTIPARQTAIDYMKAFLVIGMIIAHALQLLSTPRGVLWLFSVCVNLITFSGFLFCFGYVFYTAYLSRPAQQVTGKMMKTAWKTLMGYYVSAFASLVLLSSHFTHKPYSPSYQTVFDLLCLIRIPWYSEFLLAFFLLTILTRLFFEPIKQLLEKRWALLTISAGCLLLAAWLPPDLRLGNAVGLLIGTSDDTVYPLVQYLPIFLAGLYFSKNRITWNRTAFCLSLLGSGLFVWYYVRVGSLPLRFPPSWYWLVGSYGVLYGYYLLANWLNQKEVIIPVLLTMGRHTLLYLLLSNIFLFALSDHIVVSPFAALGFGVGILMVITFIVGLVNQSAK